MKIISTMTFLMCFTLLADHLDPLPIDFIEDKKNSSKKIEKSKNAKSKKKSFEELTKDMTSALGFFDFYIDKNSNKVYISIKPDQFEEEFLMGLTRQSGDGWQFDGSSMQGEGVYFFKRVGEVVQLIQKNTKFRADNSKPIYKSLSNHIPNSIISSSKNIVLPDTIGHKNILKKPAM